MRSVPDTFWDLWSNGGPFIGEDGKPHTRVTVEPDWQLNKVESAGNFKKGPVRWWQRADNSQIEVEVPNIAMVSIDRSLDQDAASCEIELYNQWHISINGATIVGEQEDPDQLGFPGYFTWNRGTNPDATARWGHTKNDWEGVLVPNALLRTYQGFGGHDKTIAEALEDGNLILTGVWLIDEIRVGSNGRLRISCRDMAKLLIEQYIFPPLVPTTYYPVTYCNTPEAPIWMGDFTFREIGDIKVGDEVIGFAKDDGPLNQVKRSATGVRQYQRMKLQRARVVDVIRREAPVVKITMASGKTIRCTADHKWLKDSKNGQVVYEPAAIGKNLVHVIDVPDEVEPDLQWAAGYLAGMYDGEGCGERIAQYRDRNPEQYAKIQECLELLGFDYVAHDKGFRIVGGKQALVDLLCKTRAVKRANKSLDRRILNGKFRHCGDEVIAIEPDGISEVISLTTTTGNYVAWGYASKNCRWNYEAGGNPQVFYGSRSRDENDPGAFFEIFSQWSASSANPDGIVRPIHGHRETDATDDNSETFWLSEGKASATDTVYYEITVNQEINALQWDPWGGLYQTYVSVMEDGEWVGDESIDGTPFLVQLGTPWEARTSVVFDRIYRAEKVRLTFTNLVLSQWGDPYYRAGLRLIMAGRQYLPATPAKIVTSMAVHPGGEGYWLLGSDGGVFAFGPDPSFQGSSGGGNTENPWIGIAQTVTGDGYWAARSNGQVQVFGDAVHYGDRENLPLNAPIVAFERSTTGNGYFLLGSDGGVFAFGDATFVASGSGDNYVDIAKNQAGAGYWLLRADGTVEGYGVSSLGDASITVGSVAVGIEPHPTGEGYWVVDSAGGVFAFGVCSYFGGPNTLVINSPASITSSDRGAVLAGPGINIVTDVNDKFDLTVDGDTQTVTIPAGTYRVGTIFAVVLRNAIEDVFGANKVLVFFDVLEDTIIISTYSQTPDSTIQINSPAEDSALAALGFTDGQSGVGGDEERPLNDPVSDIKSNPDGTGYWVVAEDGGVFSFGATQFWGSLPEDFGWSVKREGNYTDYVDIVKELLLWSGFWLYDPSYPDTLDPVVYGNVESTGIYSEECLPIEMFDKKPVIDALNEIRQIVGYIFFVDEEGAVHWESPNFWRPGNFINETGQYTDYIPEIDERHNLMDYSVSFSDQNLRSEIIIGSQDPTQDLTSTHSWREVMPEATEYLRGMTRPMMFVNEAFLTVDEMKIMAKLVGTHIYFKLRQASATCVANPAIQLNDQVRIFERQTGETYIHYVRSIRTEHDLESGSYTMTLGTHWLGRFPDEWALEFE